MDYDKLFDKFQTAIDAMSDEELCGKFSLMGCEVYVDKPFSASMTSRTHDFQVNSGEVSTKAQMDVDICVLSKNDSYCSAADSSELALAA